VREIAVDRRCEPRAAEAAEMPGVYDTKCVVEARCAMPAEAASLRVKNPEGTGIVVIRKDGWERCRAAMSGQHLAENLPVVRRDRRAAVMLPSLRAGRYRRWESENEYRCRKA
jgi:hypothetical protein